MPEWWTYSLTDFLLFSPRTYYRLFALYNEGVWPAHAAAFAVAAAIVAAARRYDGRVVAGLLAIVWLWVALAFHLERYATINWAATYFAAAFALEAALFFRSALVRNPIAFRLEGSFASSAGLALFLFAVVGQPLVGPLFGRDWHQAEVFGLAPDPTVVATLGLLSMARRAHWLLLAVPLLWCAVTGLTLWAMEAPDALMTPAAGALALLVAAWKTRAQ
jgi:hypothetical protein